MGRDEAIWDWGLAGQRDDGEGKREGGDERKRKEKRGEKKINDIRKDFKKKVGGEEKERLEAITFIKPQDMSTREQWRNAGNH